MNRRENTGGCCPAASSALRQSPLSQTLIRKDRTPSSFKFDVFCRDPFSIFLAVRIDPGNTAATPLDFVSYPYTHRLLMAIAWATLAARVYYRFTRYTPGSMTRWAGVVSHRRLRSPRSPSGWGVPLGRMVRPAQNTWLIPPLH